MNIPSARIKADKQPLFKERVDVGGVFIKGFISNNKLTITHNMNGSPIPPILSDIKDIDRFIDELNQIKGRLR